MMRVYAYCSSTAQHHLTSPYSTWTSSWTAEQCSARKFKAESTSCRSGPARKGKKSRTDYYLAP